MSSIYLTSSQHYSETNLYTPGREKQMNVIWFTEVEEEMRVNDAYDEMNASNKVIHLTKQNYELHTTMTKFTDLNIAVAFHYFM